MSTVMRFCRSRNAGRRCTRELGHRGLHRSRTILWTDAGADEPRCQGSGAVADAAPTLPDGFPAGRALCPHCLGFVGLDANRLREHDTADGHSDSETEQRAEWFNRHGWSS
jgi:hypothetical protein